MYKLTRITNNEKNGSTKINHSQLDILKMYVYAGVDVYQYGFPALPVKTAK